MFIPFIQPLLSEGFSFVVTNFLFDKCQVLMKESVLFTILHENRGPFKGMVSLRGPF